MLRAIWGQESGNVSIIGAFSFSALAVAAGFAVDHSTLVRSHDDIQNIADTAALAAARQMGASTEESDADREEIAISTATDFIASRNADIVFTVEPSIDHATVHVSASLNQPVAFGAFFGQSHRRVGAEATATYLAEQPSGCMIALDESEAGGIRLQGSARIKGPACGIWSNAAGSASIYMQGSPSLEGREVCANGSSGNAVAKIEPEISTDCGVSPDPYDGALDAIPTVCDHVNFAFPKKATEAELDKGVYCGGLDIAGIDVTLKPGLYVIKDGTLSISSNATVVGEGVSIVLTGKGASLRMQGSPDVTLTAMTTGALAGIALAVTETGEEASKSEMQGSPTLTITGSVYMPEQQLDLQGNPKFTVKGDESKLVAGSYDLQGNPDVTVEANDTVIQSADVSLLRLLR